MPRTGRPRRHSRSKAQVSNPQFLHHQERQAPPTLPGFPPRGVQRSPGFRSPRLRPRHFALRGVEGGPRLPLLQVHVNPYFRKWMVCFAV